MKVPKMNHMRICFHMRKFAVVHERPAWHLRVWGDECVFGKLAKSINAESQFSEYNAIIPKGLSEITINLLNHLKSELSWKVIEQINGQGTDVAAFGITEACPKQNVSANPVAKENPKQNRFGHISGKPLPETKSCRAHFRKKNARNVAETFLGILL